MEEHDVELEKTVANLKSQLVDISKKLDQEQRKSRHLEHIIASMPGHFYWMDREGHILGCNDQQARSFGFDKSTNLIGRNIYDVANQLGWDQSIPDTIRKNDDAVILFDKSIIAEEKAVLNNKQKTFLSHKAPLRDDEDKIIGIIGTAIDITDRKTEKNMLENVIAFMPGHVYWQNKDGIILGCNDEQAKDLGLASRLDIIGKTAYDLQSTKQAEHLQTTNDEVLKSGKPQLAEEESTLANGKTKVFLSHKVPLYSQEHEVVGLVGISVDITARKQMEKELQQAKETAETANEVKTNFIRNMQHDIRTPLSGIWGMADILERRIKNHEMQEFMNNIKLCSKELLDYCDSILDFANIEQGYPLILAKKFNARSLITRVSFLEETAANAKGLKLIIDYPKTLPEIFIGDEFRIYRILVNLISNAIKFTDKGYVEVRLKEIGRNVKNKEIILQFIVKDTGIGMPKDRQKFIFEKFARLTPSNRGKYKGLGLGLRIVKEFMTDIGGEIDVESKPAIGTTLICTIPLKLPLVDKMIGDDENE